MIQDDIVSMEMPTTFGNFRLYVWNGERGRELVALTSATINPAREIMLRIHSECLTGDLFHSLTCDCGPQKDLALKKIQEHSNGVFIYHRQEGRNTGLFNKIRSYNLMEEGMDTHQALLSVVGHPDPREYTDVLTTLDHLLGGTKSKIRLLTNNPYKALFLERHGYEVVVEPLRSGASVHNASYMQAKTEKFLHDTVGYGPYASITLTRADLQDQMQDIMTALWDIKPFTSGRKLFIGVELHPEHGDLKDEHLLEELENLHRVLQRTENSHLVLHMDYPLARSVQRELKRFLNRLKFEYSLQFRLPSEAVIDTRVDVDLLDTLHAQHVIFQLRKEHFSLLRQKSFVDYFSSSHKFIMVDESFGNGKEENVSATRERILRLVSSGLSRIAVAGGYYAKNVSRVHELEDYFKLPISVDAETKLRTNGAFDAEKAQQYLNFFFQKSETL